MAQLIVGYKGYIELFYRHRKALDLTFRIIYSKEEYEISYGTNSFIKHIPKFCEDKGEPIIYYAVANLKNGGQIFVALSREECIEHGKKHSKCYSKEKKQFVYNTPWQKEPDAMCLKTALLHLMKMLPKSTLIHRAIEFDETTKTKIKRSMLSVKDETNWDSIPEEPKEAA